MPKYNVMAYYGHTAARRGSWALYTASNPKKAILKAKKEMTARGFTVRKGTHGWKAIRVPIRRKTISRLWTGRLFV